MLSRVSRCAECRELIDPPGAAVILEKPRPLHMSGDQQWQPDRKTVHRGHEARLRREGYREVPPR